MIDVKTVDSCDAAAKQAADFVVSQLTKHSAKNNLLLVSGGSSVKAAYWASSNMDINMTNSTVLAQVDERYGEIDHPDSNWRALSQAGVDGSIFMQFLEMLKLGVSADDIASQYSRQLQHQLDTADYSIAILGVGSDGHIAGMLPMDETKFSDLFLSFPLAAAYQGDDFQRITLTAKALLQIDQIVVFACGQNKQSAIEQLNIPHQPHQYPAEILKQCKKVNVFYGAEG